MDVKLAVKDLTNFENIFLTSEERFETYKEKRPDKKTVCQS